MFVCSVIIIIKIYSKSTQLRPTNRRSKKLSRNKQLFLILFTTNSLFVCMISPLVLLNATGIEKYKSLLRILINSPMGVSLKQDQMGGKIINVYLNILLDSFSWEC